MSLKEVHVKHFKILLYINNLFKGIDFAKKQKKKKKKIRQ